MTWISSSTITLGRGINTLPPSHLRSSILLTRCMSSSSSTATPDKSHLITTYPSSAFPSGYAVSSTHSGIKSKSPSSPDLGVLISTSPNPCIAAATFTRNVFKAAPVQVSNEVIKMQGGKVRGFVVSSGCANAVTGQRGLEDAWKMSKTVDDHAPHSLTAAAEVGGTLVMSTGVIGQHLPIEKITTSIPPLLSSLSSTPEAWLGLAKAFMTTDTFPKLRTREFKINDQLIKLVGIDKGAGMIHPNMGPPHGTLLGVIATDAKVHPEALQKALGWAVDRSFNSITVDGDMSTNDTVLCLANGAAGTSEGGSSGGMKEISEKGTPEEYEVFKNELTGFAEELAQLVVRDGEGATKFVTVRVENAPTYEVARKVASSIATSSLVKTAMYGEDANWGRILCAVGYTDVPEGTISPTSVSVSFVPPSSSSNPTPLRLLTNGEPEPKIDEARASEILAQEDLEVLVDLGVEGGEKANYWTCDFSHEYVTINGHYRT